LCAADHAGGCFSLLAAFVFGFGGGVIAEVASISAHRHRKREMWPGYTRQFRYWGLGLCWVVIGGAIPAIYTWDGSNLSAWASVNLGLTAPLVIHTAMRAIPPGPPGSSDLEVSQPTEAGSR
jgi:hypothetical protein